MKSKEELEK